MPSPNEVTVLKVEGLAEQEVSWMSAPTHRLPGALCRVCNLNNCLWGCRAGVLEICAEAAARWRPPRIQRAQASARVQMATWATELWPGALP